MALPDLTAVLTAKTDGFETALARSQKSVEDLAKKVTSSTESIQQGFERLKSAAESLGIALSIGEFVELIKNTVEAEEHLGNLAQKAGVTVEALGGLALAARSSGIDIDSLAQGLSKLDKSIAQAGAGNVQDVEVFKSLGVAFKDATGEARDANAVFIDLAKAFAGYADGPNKTALAVLLLGKAGADLIPVLNQGSVALQAQQDYYQRYSGVTAETVKQSSEFGETMNKLNLLGGAFTKTLAADLLPSMQGVADEFLKAKENGDQFKSMADDLTVVLKGAATAATYVAQVVGAVGDRIGLLAAKAAAAADVVTAGMSGNPESLTGPSDETVAATTKAVAALRTLNEAADENAEVRIKRFDGLRDAINGVGAAAKNVDLSRLKFGDSSYYGSKLPQAPSPPNASKGADVDNDKKVLDLALVQLDKYIVEEKSKLSDRESFLQLYYARNFLSVQDYYQGVQAARDEALANERHDYDEEIADLVAFITKKRAAGDDHSTGLALEAEKTLVEVRAKRAKLDTDAATATLKNTLAQQEAVEKYHDTLASLDAQLKTIAGDSAAAFEINFDQQNRDKVRQLTAALAHATNSQDAADAQTGLDNLDRLRAQGLATAKLNDLSTQRSAILGDLANQQDRITLAVDRGSKTELQGLADSDEANKLRIASLEQIAAAYDKIAESSNNIQDKVNADALHVQLDKLKAQTTQVADAFNDAAKDITENFIDKLTDKTATLHDKIKSLLDDIGKRVLKQGEDLIGNYLFGKDGGLLSGAGKELESVIKPSAGATASSIPGSLGAANSAGGASADAANDPMGDFIKQIDTANTGLSDLSTNGIAGAAKSAYNYIVQLVTGTSAQTAATTATSSAATSLTALTTAATNAAAALASVATSGGGSSASGLGGLLGASSSADSGDALLDSGLLASAKGNAFLGGNVLAFARGGVVDRATVMPMALMGEAGPEAIMPLRRRRDGTLGIATPAAAPQATQKTEIHLHYYPTPGESRATTTQRGATLFRQGQLAASRNS